MNANSRVAVKAKTRIETKILALVALQAKMQARIECASREQTSDLEDAMSPDEVTPQGGGDEVADECYDCEIGFKDDDTAFDEGVGVEFGRKDSWIGEEAAESAFIPADYYEIRIIKKTHDEVDCIVQDDEWSSADGLPNYDQLIVAHSQKMKWLKILATWLKKNYCAQLAMGPEAFNKTCPLASQESVYQEKKLKSAFGRFIRCVRIVWECGSVPAWRIFKQ